MASPARVMTLPSTLPADFGEWDDGVGSAQPAEPVLLAPAPDMRASAPPQPVPQGLAEFPRSRPPVAAHTVYTSEESFLDRLIAMHPEPGAPHRDAAPAPVSAGAIYEVVPPPARSKGPRVQAGRSKPAAGRAPGTDANAALNQNEESAGESIRPGLAARAGQKPAARMPVILERARGKKRVVLIAAASFLLMLLFLSFTIFHRGRHAILTRPASVMPANAAAQPQPHALKPSPSVSVNPAPAPAADPAPPPADAPAADPQAAAPPPVSAQMMNDQLSAPARITSEMKSKPAEDAPPAALDATALGGSASPGGALSGQAYSRVQAAPPKFINVSAGVAVGLLIRKTPPVYPSIAQAAHVSGTVVLAATISRTGSIENLRVVTGPAMLRQAALEAVRTWRYRPYKLNYQPTEIETTINVVFALQG